MCTHTHKNMHMYARSYTHLIVRPAARYLSHGLGIILVFIGLKMLLVQVGVHVSIEATLAIVLAVLAIAIALSVVWRA